MSAPRFEPYIDDGRDGYLLYSDYHPGFVAELKTLPVRDRSWLPDPTKAWWIAAESFDLAVHIVRRYFGAHEIVDTDTGEVTLVEADGSRHRQERML